MLNIITKKEKAAHTPSKGIFCLVTSCFIFIIALLHTGTIATPKVAQVEGLR
ncbi:hypothetical protein D3C80_2070940 [compost metagenome]